MRPMLIGGDRAGFPRDVHPRDPQWPLNVGSGRPLRADKEATPQAANRSAQNSLKSGQ
jgi:hypothetical protein